jgi:O-antigen ligase
MGAKNRGAKIMINISLLVLFFFPAFTISGQIARSIAIAMCLLCAHPTIARRLAEPGILLITWFIWAIFCSYQSEYFQLALFGYHKRFEGIITWILALSFGWLFWRTSSLKSLFLYCKIILGICFAVMVFKPEIYKSLIYGHITIAAFASIISCMLISRNIAWIGLAIPFVYLTQVRSMLLAIGLASLAYLALNRHKIKDLFGNNWTPWVVTVIILPLTLIAAYPKLSSMNLRSLGTGARSQFAWQSIEAITLKPFTGYGIDTQSKILKPAIVGSEEYHEHDRGDGVMIKRIFDVDRAHNFFLDILLQTGFIGLILWLFILTRIVYRTFSYPSEINTACMYGACGAISYGLTNPCGIPCLFMLCLCVLGIERDSNEVK